MIVVKKDATPGSVRPAAQPPANPGVGCTRQPQQLQGQVWGIIGERPKSTHVRVCGC